MHALILLCHPEPSSYNASQAAIARETLEAAGATVAVSDLYAEDFNPVESGARYPSRHDPTVFAALAEQRHAYQTDAIPEDVRREITRLEQADLLILQFPIWWHGAPAMVKGWMDRVFLSGGLYTSKMRYDRGRFRGKRALCSVTTGAPAAAFAPGGRGGEIAQILWSTQYSLHYMGFSVLAPFVVHGVQGHGYAYAAETEAARALAAGRAELAARLARVWDETPLAYGAWDDWDADGAPRRPAR